MAVQGAIDRALANQRDYSMDCGPVNSLMVDPANVANTMLYIRKKSVDSQGRMPPLGRVLEDTDYLNVLEQWINGVD